jgi:hypothetical protein
MHNSPANIALSTALTVIAAAFVLTSAAVGAEPESHRVEQIDAQHPNRSP